MFKYYKAAKTILGINERNLNYTLPGNSREARSIADHKLKAKRFLRARSIPVPDTYAIIRSKDALAKFHWDALPASFVVKPNKGFGGEGILIIYGRKKRKTIEDEIEWILSDGRIINKSTMVAHMQQILEGNYSLKNNPDRAVIEERLKNVKILKPYLYKGVPSVRVVCYNMIPVMADIKLPTKESNGKANLHAGGVVVGIDIASGLTTLAIQHDKIIEFHPDTKMRLSGFKIPFWNKILELAVKSQEATGLGYIGVDIAIDRDKGPVVLEVNARPGLGTQIANNDGLKERLLRIKKLKVTSVKKGMRIGKELFGGEIEEEVEELLGKKIIGLHIPLQISGKKEKKVSVRAKVDTGASLTSIDRDVAIALGYEDLIIYIDSLNFASLIGYEAIKAHYNEHRLAVVAGHPDLEDIDIFNSSSGTTLRPEINIQMKIEGIDIKTKVSIINRKGLKFPVIIGAKDLDSFIIDVTKT